MKTTIRIVQVLVGILFIISGLVKANDPLGLAYKMEEFFELWNAGLAGGHFFARTPLMAVIHLLDGHALFLSIFMNTLEIVAGVALIMGWMKETILYLLLGLTIFFTFLTGYAYLSGKFSNCGCFGDCLPITPLISFGKDIALLLAITLLMKGRKHLFVLSTGRAGWSIVSASLLFSLLVQWYVLNYLPMVDCLPLKKGNNISEQIVPPANAIPSVYETSLVYQNLASHEVREMSQEEFNNSKIWEDKGWKWVETKTKMLKQGTDIPKLHNFSLTDIGGNDITESVLKDTGYQILYFVDAAEDRRTIDPSILNTAAGTRIPILFVTTQPAAFPAHLKDRLAVCDGTVFRIAARVNPVIYLLKGGTILYKWPLKKKTTILNTINNLKHQQG